MARGAAAFAGREGNLCVQIFSPQSAVHLGELHPARDVYEVILKTSR
jgi:hypothetical protein